MSHMPEWFAKTPEMIACDRYFGVADEGVLVERYEQALTRLAGDADYAGDSDALQSEAPDRLAPGLQGHFRGDWIHKLYPDPAYASAGGRFWPEIPSELVVGRIRFGTRIAILKALGRPRASTFVPGSLLERLFEYEEAIGLDVAGVLPLATSWNCVAPTGSNFFEVESIRGPTIVEFAIATPRPQGSSRIMSLVEDYELGLLDGESSA